MNKLNILKKDAVNNMINALEEYAEKNKVILKGNIPDNVNKLDDLFHDGGEGRCEHFTDLAHEYCFQFSNDMEDYQNIGGFQTHYWSCIDTAMLKLRRKYELNTAL